MVLSTITGLDIAAGVAALVGLALIGRGLLQYRRLATAVRRAEATTGTVETADIELARGAQGSVSYIPAVEYTYQTPTQRRRGETLYPGQSRFVKRFGTESAARNAVDAYEADSQTRVYYDPNEPTHSFLDPELQTGPVISQVGVGVVSLGLAVLLRFVL